MNHAMKTAKTAADLALARKRVEHAQEQHDQAMRHRDEAHQAAQAQPKAGNPSG